MKFFSIFMIALLAFFNASAQVVSVELKLDQDQFLPGETLPVTVRVSNNSGQTLRLGADQGWLKFNIVARDNNSAVIRNSNPSVVGVFNLNSSEVATKRVDIAPSFELKKAG
ncbi:MAG TPA: hypothetical protein VN516_03455, partial [Candidatus Baltobacteraceae bacterium]|nr:hypothetical protein [Candidatus Baltobacteraceae bacterium]